jgi:acyl-CoA synthetase (NDP forming)
MPSAIDPGARHCFAPMFSPRGIAVVGASPDPARPGGQTIQALTTSGYAHGIYPVNPRYPTIGDLQCYPSIDAISGHCDVAVIALPAPQVPPVIEQCGTKGIRFAVVLGGGFKESGATGTALESQLVKAAETHGIRIIGPNCLGYVNVPNNVFAGFGSITKPPKLLPGPVSAVLQSGGFGNSLVIQAALSGVGFQNVVTCGNEANTHAADLINAFVDDPQTKIILAYIEGVPDGRVFMEAARHALSARKPIVALKGGISRNGLKAAASHTACLLAPHDLYRAAFRQCGVIEARDIGDAVDYLLCLMSARFPTGRKVAVMGGSGGSSVNFCDAADEFGLTIAELSPATTQVLKRNLPSIATTTNPIDFTAGFVTDNNLPLFQESIEAVLTDPSVDQFSLLAATSSGKSYINQATAVVAALKKTGKQALVFSCMSDKDAGPGAAIFKAAGIPVLPTPRRIAAAMSAMATYSDALQYQSRAAFVSDGTNQTTFPLPPGTADLDELASKAILRDAGIRTTADYFLEKGETLRQLPDGMAFPVAVKIVSPDIAHKSDIGGVRLNITDEKELQTVIREVIASATSAAPGAWIRGILISEMVRDKLETIVGVVNDEVFGPVVALGLGGTLAETINDTTWRIAPFGVDTAKAMLCELRGASLFNGLRGQSPRDIEALAKCVAQVSHLAWTLRLRLQTLDINPLLVLKSGAGVIAADAVLSLKSGR